MNKFQNLLEELMAYSDVITENTELYQFIAQINYLMHSNGVKKILSNPYQSYKTVLSMFPKPFLSVILRTQGKRPTGLREALLSLRAQTNQDFEIILIGHKASEEGKLCIHQILKEQPEFMRQKIQYLEIEEGTRTTPINIGFTCATGQYVSIFDDDDLLFDSWVEKFHEAAQKHPGKILHAYVLAQKWRSIQMNKNQSNEDSGYVAIAAPTSQYCCSFDLLSQLVVNQCPLMGLAFPAYLHQRMGMYFNEELNVTEDWEYFMRVAPIAGVIDIPEATSIYRLWENVENSYSLHSQEAWMSTYQLIQNYMDGKSLLVPAGYPKHIAALIRRCNSQVSMGSGFPRVLGLIYYRTADGTFSDEAMIPANNREKLPEFHMEFAVPDIGKQLADFRFDPCEFGGFILKNLSIIQVTEAGEKIPVQMKDCIHNGFNCDRGIYFLHYDPQIVWHYECPYAIVKIIIEGTYDMEIPENLIQSVISQYEVPNHSNVLKKVLSRLFK